MTSSGAFQFKPHLQGQLRRIGRAQNPLLIIDDALQNPDDLVGWACQGQGFKEVTGDFYPGKRRGLPPEFSENLLAALAKPVRQAFAAGQAQVTFSALSLTTRAPAQALPIQRIPHFDTTAATQLAMVLYLCKPPLGGTSFYRHRATGYESISDDRMTPYRKTLEQEALPDPAYIDGDTALFDRTLEVEGRYNRMVIYHSNLLHSGTIRGALWDDPARGRLTANAFITYKKQDGKIHD